MPSSPVVANWELVLRLRERREELKLSINDVATPLRFSRNYWSAIENEHKPIPANRLTQAFHVLRFDDQERRELLALHGEAQSDGWWHQHPKLLGNDLQRLIGLEHGARGVRDFEPLLIPGLLQTPAYIRAILDASASIRQTEVEERVDLRLRRQQRLADDNPLELQVLITEATLRQHIGGATTLKGQLDHLLNMMDQDNVDIRVIPFTSGSCTLFGGGTLILMDFPSPRLPRAVWAESVSTWGFIADTNKVRDITIAFDQALEHTLDSRQTKNLIANYRKEFR